MVQTMAGWSGTGALKTEMNDIGNGDQVAQISVHEAHKLDLGADSYHAIMGCLEDVGDRARKRLGEERVREILRTTFIWAVRAAYGDRIATKDLTMLTRLHKEASRLPVGAAKRAACAQLRRELQSFRTLEYPPPGSQQFDYERWRVAEALQEEFSEDLERRKPLSKKAKALLAQLRGVDPSQYALPETFLAQLGQWIRYETIWIREERKNHLRGGHPPVHLQERALDGILQGTFRTLALKTSSRSLYDSVRHMEVRFIVTALAAFRGELERVGILNSSGNHFLRVWTPRGIEDVRARLLETQSNPKLQKIEAHERQSFILFLEINYLRRTASSS
jgi:hypothetical protein